MVQEFFVSWETRFLSAKRAKERMFEHALDCAASSDHVRKITEFSKCRFTIAANDFVHGTTIAAEDSISHLDKIEAQWKRPSLLLPLLRTNQSIDPSKSAIPFQKWIAPLNNPDVDSVSRLLSMPFLLLLS
jgi:hypothetical protein